MGLMGSNPYAVDNPMAVALNSLRSGFKDGYSGAMDRRRMDADIENQQMIRAQQQQQLDMQKQAAKQEQARQAMFQQAQSDLQARVAPRPLVDEYGTPTDLGEGLMPPEFKEQYRGPYADPSQAVQQVSNPAWGETLGAMQKRKEVPALPLTTPELASFGVRMGDKNILEKLIPKENTTRMDLLKTGKYDPESVDAYLGGTGKLKFAAEPFVYKDRNYEKGDKKYYEESMDGGRTWKPVSDAPRYRPTNGNGEGKSKGRPMPASTAKILTSAAGLADAMDRFSTGFQPEYAGHIITGGLSTATGKLFGDSTGQVNFWQDYQGYINDVRHEKFGAALTPGEKTEFLKYIITERTDPQIAADNLAMQKSIVDVALARSSRGYARQYNPTTVEEFTGRPIPSADAGKVVPPPYKKPPASGKQPPLGKVGKHSYTVTGQ